MEEFQSMEIKPKHINPSFVGPDGINLAVTSEIDRSLSAAVEANKNIEQTLAANIQKRGFTYNGDRHQGFGLGGQGFGLHGLTGQVGGLGRGFGGSSFTLQPFGIGTPGLLQGLGSASATIFNGSGSNVAINKNTQVAHLKMAMVVEAYKGFGIVKNVLDLMCNFASEGLKIIHPSPAVQRFYERWAQIVDLTGRAKHILRSYYKHGNVFIYTTMATVGDVSRRHMMSTRGDSNDPSQDEREDFVEEQKNKPLGDRKIPWQYTILNPFQMDIRGSKFFGESHWVFILDPETFRDIANKEARSAENVDVLDETEINLPSEFKNLKILEGRALVLDADKLWTIQYMKDDHEDWADPMVWPVMNDIMYKHDLRAMDRSVINSTINAIQIFKLGSAQNGFVAPPEHYQQFAQMLRTPTASHNIIWNDMISIESNYPPIEKILGVEKYRSVDKDILAGLGIPSILVDGGAGGSFSNAFLQVRTLLERLEDGREEVIKWLRKQLRMIAEIMGHRDVPQIRFGNMSLRDEEAEKKLIIQLMDRNVISAERVHEVFGIETVIEIERIRREDKLAEEENIFVKHGPYTDPMTDLSPEEMSEMEFEQQKELVTRKMKSQRQQQKKNGKPGGRPGGSTGIPQEKKRVTKPKGMGIGSFEYYAKVKGLLEDSYARIESSLTHKMLELKNVKYKKSLSGEDRKLLDNLVFIVFSNLESPNTLSSDAFVDRQLKDIKINPEAAAIEQSLWMLSSSNNSQALRANRVMAMAQYFYQGEI